ncbi:MAG: site-specific DNA-methyltransferase [Flavobacteriaceae bacterium]|nr:site-specific DNA-methyltransferase [Flavobacteriaceae bacterium]
MSNEQKITTDIKVPNKDLEALRLNFPHCFDKDGNFQLEKFKANLTEKEINFSTESYGLDWLGKSYARLLASDPATTLLKADETHNSKPENANSENLLIKSDNLEVLKHLANAYYEQVKMIYIDPPYNTGSDGFVYEDDRKFTVKELQNLIGVDAEKAKRILSFTQSKSNSHSAWLTFLYPRLYIAKQLLKEDGVIFISIDDNEVSQLRLLMDEIFGEQNFISSYVWESTFRPDNSSKIYRKNAENVLCYAKVIGKIDRLIGSKDGSDGLPSLTKNSMNEGVLNFKANIVETHLENGTYPKGLKSSGYELLNDVEVKDGRIINDFGLKGRMIWGQTYLEEELSKDTRIIIKTDGFVPYTKKVETSILAPNTIIPNDKVADVLQGRAEVTSLFGKAVFDYPKPTTLIKYLCSYFEANNYVVLDFFAGSGTSGDAVMQLNAEDGGCRKFILVQLPEEIDANKNKTAYSFVKNELKAEPTIFEITKERLLRAARKINAGLDEKITKLKAELPTEETQAEIKKLENCKTQNTFKIFETSPIWEDYNFEAEQFDSSQTLFDVGKLSEDDIKALLITWKTYDGIALTEDLESVDLSGYTASYGNGRLYLMNKGFTTESLKALLEKIDTDKHFEPKSIIAFGYHLESKSLREISENVKTYNNKKKSDIDFITRY